MSSPAYGQTPGEAIEYYATDAIGSIRVAFDDAGNVKARSDYLPFGEAWEPEGNLPPQRYTGQERDGEAGLDNFNARVYSPRVGRFSRTDPLFAGPKAPQSWNRYSYAANNPLTFVDPTGAYNTPVTNCNPAVGDTKWCPGYISPFDSDKFFDPSQYGYQGGEELETAEQRSVRRVTRTRGVGAC